jgi:hypothetical protein
MKVNVQIERAAESLNQGDGSSHSARARQAGFANEVTRDRAIGSLILTRPIASLLFGVGAADPTTFAIVAAILLATALAACFAPARRALRVHPSEVLRYG